MCCLKLFCLDRDSCLIAIFKPKMFSKVFMDLKQVKKAT